MKRLRMEDRILRHLEDKGSITTWEAIQEYGCTKLQEYIRRLRKIYDIADEWIEFINRYGEKSKYKKYFLKKKED